MRKRPERALPFLRGCAGMSDRRGRKSHAVRRVRPDAMRTVRGFGEPQQAAMEYRFRYSIALLAFGCGVNLTAGYSPGPPASNPVR